MFTVEDRGRVRAHVLELAAADPQIVAAAVVGSLAHGGGDRWSDVDLTFAVEDGTTVEESRAAVQAVMTRWTADLAETFGAVDLFDLPVGDTVYRVFLLPGCLQVDLSWSPAAGFAARGPRFELLYGSTPPPAELEPSPPRELVGMAVHHAVRARFCIERGRLWQAEHWVSGIRHLALELACRVRGLDGSYGRDVDRLGEGVLAAAGATLVATVDAAELRRALSAAVALLVQAARDADALSPAVVDRLSELRG